MLDILTTWFLSATALFITAKIVSGFNVNSYGSAFIASAMIGLLNVTLKPILFVLTLPINILTLGLFTFIVNAVVLKVAAKILKDFEIRGWLPAIVGGIVLSLVNMLLFAVFPTTMY